MVVSLDSLIWIESPISSHAIVFNKSSYQFFWDLMNASKCKISINADAFVLSIFWKEQQISTAKRHRPGLREPGCTVCIYSL
jgi:hypothetical protein